jgi:hypothetical protein
LLLTLAAGLTLSPLTSLLLLEVGVVVLAQVRVLAAAAALVDIENLLVSL